MRIEYQLSSGGCQVLLIGELDHHAAKSAIAEINGWLDQTMPSRLTLNFGRVGFMDSSGIALAMCLHRRMAGMGGKMTIRSLPPFARRIFRAAGVDKLLDLSA